MLTHTKAVLWDWLSEVQLYPTKWSCRFAFSSFNGFHIKAAGFQVTIMGLNLIVFQALVDPWCGINVHTASLILSTVLGEKWKAISHPFCSGGKKGKVNCLRCICAQPSLTFPSGYPAGLSNSTHPKLNSFPSTFQNTSLF